MLMWCTKWPIQWVLSRYHSIVWHLFGDNNAVWHYFVDNVIWHLFGDNQCYLASFWRQIWHNFGDKQHQNLMRLRPPIWSHYIAPNCLNSPSGYLIYVLRVRWLNASSFEAIHPKLIRGIEGPQTMKQLQLHLSTFYVTLSELIILFFWACFWFWHQFLISKLSNFWLRDV